MFVRKISLIPLLFATALFAMSSLVSANMGLGVEMEAAPVAHIQGRGGIGICNDIVSCAIQCLDETGTVTGAVTDGETKIILTVSRTDGQPLDPGTVKLFFDDGYQAPDDGGFGEVGSDDRLAEVTVSIQDGIAQAQFFTPEEFNGPTSEYQRQVTWSAEYTPASGGDPITGSGFELLLSRPALVLTHGLWSSQDTWDTGLYFREITFRVDYSDSNASSFDHNQDKAAQGILNACEGMRRQRGIAMRKIDFAGHSMGGILGRHFDAAHEGYINKLFTLNTPHTGSPLANLLVELRDELNIATRILADRALNALGFAWHRGAIHDLQKGSPALSAMGATSIPSHALAGTGGSDLLVNNEIAGVLRQIIDWMVGTGLISFNPVEFLDCPFQGAQHDFIVGLCSQQGGCSSSSQFGGIGSIHTAVTGSSAYASRIKDLLNVSADSDDFGNFPAPSSVGDDWQRPDCFDLYLGLLPGWATGFSDDTEQTRGDSGPKIQIIEPAPGTVFAPFDDLTVTIAPVGDFDLQQGAVHIPAIDASQSWFNPPFTHTFFIPGDFSGELEITAIGTDLQGPGSPAEPVTVYVVPGYTLEAIWLVSDDPQVMVGPGDTRQISVEGLFSDEVIRNITHSSTGTTYQSADPDIVQVTPDGLLIPQDIFEDSETTVTITNDGHQVTMTAIVLGIPLDDIFDDRFQFGQ